MDKKNTTLGILLLVGAFVLMSYNANRTPPPSPPPAAVPATPESGPAGPAATGPEGAATPPGMSAAPASAAAPGAALTLPAATATGNELFAPLEPPRSDERLVTLGNEFVDVHFTNYGGAIASITLKKHLARKGSEEPLVLNADHHAPTLALSGFPGADYGTAYTLVSQSTDQVVWRTVVAGQLEITRTYTLSRDPAQQDPYVIRNDTTLRNVGAGAVNLPARLQLNLGTAQPYHESDSGTYLSVSHYDGDDANFVPRDNLRGGGFWAWLGLADGSPKSKVEYFGATVWAAVENQFFATIVTPTKKAGVGVIVRRVELPALATSTVPRIGVTGDLLVDGFSLAPAVAETLSFDIYAGPKEFHRLQPMAQEQVKVMQWGWFTTISALLLTLLKWVQSLVGNWGVAIIGTTVIIRTLLWPLTGIQTRAAKRMAKIQGPMKEIQEKYKDDRVKQQEATLKLFKEHKVNPLGGCLPLLVQMPIFFGLFSMLRSASELRFADFLWVPDLSAPDTIAYIPGIHFPINIMPLLMGATQIIQMKLSPTPATDNASARMMKFMPYFITAICYNFSSGLAVYWTASNCFSILQQWVTNRQRDKEETTPAKPGPAKPGAAERAKPVRDAKVETVRDPKKKKK